MKLTRDGDVRGKRLWMGCWIALLTGMLLAAGAALLGAAASAQGVTTTTVQGTMYLANGQAGAGTLVLSWPAFTTAAGQAIAADSLTVTIPTSGFLSVNLAANQGATPAGEYYTALFYMSDGSTSTEYWVVPAASQATIAQVRAQVMPAAQAVQAVNKAYVDQSISQLSQSLLTASGGTLSGPLTLSGDPTQPLQAADKHYVDTQVATAVPLSGGSMTGGLILSSDPTQPMQAADKEYVDAAANTWPAMVLRADEYSGTDFGAKLQACLNAVSPSYGGTCDARNFTGNQTMSANVTIATANTTVLLPCATIGTASQIVVAAGARNVALRGCALRGGSQASGSQGGTALAYSGAGATIQVGDPAYAVDTPGFHLDNVVINTTGAASASAEGLAAYRTQEIELQGVYLLGNQNQTGITLDGTGNYTGGTFLDDQIDGFGTAVNAIGHQVANPATTDWLNASAFVRLHIDCPTSGGNPIAGTYGINLQQGDGNTFSGGDVEGCATALHLGANAQNNTFVGLRNENSTNQVVADAGSSYNSWITGGTMFTGKLTDNGTRNSFLDAFHRNFNTLNGDQWRSQADATVTNHVYTGVGLGNVRGRIDEYITDVPGSAGSYQNAWQWGPGDGTSGQQLWALQDMLNNVPRFGVQQFTTAGGAAQSYLNGAGTGLVCFNCSANSGTGGVSFGSGGASPATVATVSNSGNAQFNGTLLVGGTAQFAGTPTVRNNADAEVDYYLWPGLTASQKGSFTYKDWNGNSQWYMVKDASNNWALNSATGGLDSFKAYQSTNSGDTYIDASNSSGAVRVNYESGSGAAFKVYGGNSSTLYEAFTSPAAWQVPGMAAASGHNCLQVDTSGYITNTGSACGSGSGGGSGTVNAGTAGQIAYYSAAGTAVSGTNTVPVTAGGTGAASAAAGLANLGGVPLAGGTLTGALTAPQFNGPVTGNVTGNAATATALAAAPAQCGANSYATGIGANGSANCAQVSYSQLSGTAPTWNQSTTGTASNVTGTVAVANGGTGATSAAAAVANLLPGVATNGANGISVAGNTQLSGALGVTGAATFASTPVVENQANAEIDSALQAGSTASQKESFLFRDYNGSNQWYMVKDASNNWALNSALGGLDSLKAYQSTNSGDTYIGASNSTGVVRVNYESGSGTQFKVYGGSSSALYASFTGTTSISFPGLAASSGHNCLQIDNSGYITNTGSVCGSGTASGMIGSSNTGYIAYYTGNGTTVGGISTVPVTAGGTGATTAAGGLAALGGLPLAGGTLTGALNGTSSSFSGNVAAASTLGSAPPVLDIRNPAFAGGAVCDGSTDIGPAMQAAVASMSSSGGTILLVGNPTACYWANPTTMIWQQQGSYTWTGAWQPNTSYSVNQAYIFGGYGYYVKTAYSSSSQFGTTDTANSALAAPYRLITIKVQGQLKIGTTLTLPGYVNLYGDGAYSGTQFQYAGNTAAVMGPSTTGTLGTAVTSTGVATTVSLSTMAGVYPGTILTVAGTSTCSIGSISRTSNAVVASFGSSCHIPPGARITIAGVTDSSFNGTFTVANSDYNLNTIGWPQTAANSTSSGGTAAGLNEDSVESVNVIATTGTTATAVFFRTHTAGDQWGIGGLWTDGQAKTDVKDIYVGSSGEDILAMPPWAAGGNCNSMAFTNVGAYATAASGNIANFPMELSGCYNIHINGSVALNATNDPWSLRLTNPTSGMQTATGNIFVGNGTPAFITAGIKLDHGAGVLYINGVTCEQTTRGCVSYDPTNYYAAVPQTIVIQNTGLQDNFAGYQQCYMYQLYPTAGGNARAYLHLLDVNNLGTACWTNSYFNGTVKTNGPPGGEFGIDSAMGVKGTYDDGMTMDGELRGINAALAPAAVPYATLPVITNPANWPTSGGCTIATGVTAPDGSATAGQVTPTGSLCSSVLETYNVTPAVGDTILYGGWFNNPTLGGSCAVGDGGFYIDNSGSPHFQINGAVSANAGTYDSCITNDWWHPVVGYATITSADGSSGSIRFDVTAGANNSANNAAQYWMPFMIYIPASAGIPVKEILRWRTQLLHGVVPPGMPTPANGANLAMSPAATLYWGSATDLYAGSDGSVKTDEKFNAAQGYEVNGSALGTGNLADWTNSGVANGQVPVWNASAAKWTPGNAGGGAVAAVAPATYSGTAGIAATGFYTTPAAHQYQACGFIDVIAAGSSGTVQLLVNATSDGHAASFAATGSANLGTQWSNAQSCANFYADASTPVTYQLSMSGAAGSPTVRYAVTLTQLQ